MGRKISAENTGFNPAEYSYLDDIPLKGWLWEFERRSPVYQRAYAEDEKQNPDENFLDSQSVRELIFFSSFHLDPSLPWLKVKKTVENGSPLNRTKADPVRTMNLKWMSDNLRKGKGRSGHEWPIETFLLSMKGVHQCKGNFICFENNPNHPLAVLREELGRETVVMALIDINATDIEIRDAMESDISRWRDALGIKPRRAQKTKTIEGSEFPVWKSWIMVYDLKKKSSLKEVGNILYDAFPKNNSYQDSRTVARYLQEARKMIEKGGYKRLLTSSGK